MYLVSKWPFTKEMLQNVASKSLYASDDREKPHQTPQKWRLWLYEKKAIVVAMHVMTGYGAAEV